MASIAAAMAAHWLAGQTVGLLTSGGLVTRNFQGRAVPRPLGIAMVTAYLAGAAAGSLVLGRPWVQALPYLVAVTGVGFFGLADDVLGRDQHGGIRSYTAAFLRTGRLGGGMLKAVGAALVALALAGAHRPPPGLLVDAGLIALGANAANLLDVRPGRTLLGFWLATMVVVAAGARQEVLPLLPLLAATAVLGPWDLGARAMLGDTGANALGAAAGLFAVRSLSPAGREVALVFLVLLHLVAEFGSLSRLLEGLGGVLGGRRQAKEEEMERSSGPPEE